jgi:hypothetical protein
MKINPNRFFPYPVLFHKNENYKESVFLFSFEEKDLIITNEFVKIEYSIFINDRKVLDLIKEGYLEVLVHIECTRTKLRKLFDCHIGKGSIEKIPLKDINGVIEVLPLIVVKKEIVDYYNENLSDEYRDYRFDYQLGNIFGYSDMIKIDIDKDIKEFMNLNSIVSILKDETTDKPGHKIDVMDHKIKISVPSKEYHLYNSLTKSSRYLVVTHAMMIIPAIALAISYIQKDSEEDIRYFRWYKVLSKKLEELDYIIDSQHFKNEQPFLIAQEILDYPIQKSLENLSILEV